MKPYTTTRRIAIGGTAELWLGRTAADVPCVIKRLFDAHTPAQAARLAVEREVLARVRSPHVVRALDGGEGWIALERVEGVDATALVGHLGRRGSGLAPAATVELWRAACAGLAAIHAEGLLHGDVAPGNVLIGSDGAVKLCDLGLARSIGSRAAPGEEGTLAYQPPEQLRGEAIDATADLYALALVVYELLTGVLARPAGMLGIAELLDARATVPRAPSSVRPGVPAVLDAVLLAALDPDPRRRPASADVWLRQLRATSIVGRAELLTEVVAAASKKAIPAAATAQDKLEAQPEPQPEMPETRVTEIDDTWLAGGGRTSVMKVEETRVADTQVSEVSRSLPAARWGVTALVVVGIGLGLGWWLSSRDVPASGGGELGPATVEATARPDPVAAAEASAAPGEIRAIAAPDVPGASATPGAIASPASPASTPTRPATSETPPREPSPRPRSATPSPRATITRSVIEREASDEPRPANAAPASPRLSVLTPSCALRVTGPGTDGPAPATTGPLAEGVTLLELSSGSPQLRLLLRVTRDAAGARVTFGAPRGTYYTVGCGDRRRTTPLLDVPLAGTLSCEVVTTAGERCSYALALTRAP